MGEANIKVFLIFDGSLPGALRIDLLGTAVFIVLVVFVSLELGVASPLPRFFADLSLEIRNMELNTREAGSNMPEDFLCHSFPRSRRRSRGEGGVRRDGTAELPLRDPSRRRLFLLVHVPRSALCAGLSRNTVGLLWLS